MTNGKGMNCLKNFKRVTEGLVSLYQPDTKEHDWLLLRIPKWEALASAIYNVQCFFLSQKKRDPEECDQLLYILWCAWEDSFPGQKFNKFHAAFCTARDYVHAYHMAGRVSEESNESFNAVLGNVKELLNPCRQRWEGWD